MNAKGSNLEPTPRLHYLKDGALYMLWKYLNARRLVRKAVLTFEDIVPAEVSIKVGASIFIATLYKLGINLEGISFRQQPYLKSQETDGNFVKSQPSKNMATEELKKIIDGDFTFDDVVKASDLLGDAGMIDYFEFSKDLSEKVYDQLTTFLDIYLHEFIENKLEIESQNYYRFEKQKENFLRAMKREEEKFGNQFIIKNAPHSYPSEKYLSDEAYLFIHILIAMEKLGYMTIQEIGAIEMDGFSSATQDYYTVKIVLGDKYYREMNPSQFEDKELSFDVKESKLRFKGKKIEISKTKNSDPHYLLTLIFRDKEKEWAYDEIWEDPYFRSRNKEFDPNEDWRKIYNAGYSVNGKVERATTIKDFLDVRKTSVSINRKYLG